MAIQIKDKKLHIDKVVIDNPLIVEYIDSLKQDEREKAIQDALGIGIMAGIKGEIAHFLDRAEGELGKHLGSLKALYDLQRLRFEETTAKGIIAEDQVINALRKFAKTSGFVSDEINDTSTTDGHIDGNKTGDILIRVEGDTDQLIGLEVKLDKSVGFGDLKKRDPLAKSDTALTQLIETSANRKTKLNIIVFDEEKVDNTVKKECPEGVTYIPNIGFISIVATQKNDFRNLALAYVLSRELILSKSDMSKLNENHLKIMLTQLVKVLSDYGAIKTEVSNIQSSAQKILDVSEKTRALVDHSAKYLANYLEKGQISEEELWNYINPDGVRNQLELVKKADKG